MTARVGVAGSPFGVRLRQWRLVRNLSQLDLASRVGSTPRHVSFLESGRSRPSRDMVRRLSDVLDIPARERNQLLRGAGFAPTYPAGTALAAAPFTMAVRRMLTEHEPFPGLVLDNYSRVIATNAAGASLFGRNLVGTNLIECLVTGRTAREILVNWPEIACAAMTRLRAQLDRAPQDPHLRALVDRTAPILADLPRPETTGAHSPTVHPRIRVGDTVVNLVLLSARFDAGGDTTLDEMRAELLYPLDSAAEQFFRERAPDQVDWRKYG